MLTMPSTDFEDLRREAEAHEIALIQKRAEKRDVSFLAQRERVLSVAARVKMELLAFTPPRRAIQDATLHHESQ